MSEDASKISRDTPGLKSFAAVVFAGLDARTPAPEGVVQTDPPVVPAPEGVFVSETCEGEVCWCGKPAVRKVGEEFADDEPNPNRHNLTRYICAHHFAELMGPAGARSVGIAPVVPVGVGEALTEEDRQRIDQLPFVLAMKVYRSMSKASAPVVPVGSGEPVARATCQDCGGHIEGWICQSCDRQFRENDAGNLVFEDQPVVPVGVSTEVVENLRRQRDHPTSDTLCFTTIRTCDADAIIAALRPTDTGANHD